MVFYISIRISQSDEAKVGDFEHESTVDHAIGWLQIAVGFKLAGMNKCHALPIETR